MVGRRRNTRSPASLSRSSRGPSPSGRVERRPWAARAATPGVSCAVCISLLSPPLATSASPLHGPIGLPPAGTCHEEPRELSAAECPGSLPKQPLHDEVTACLHHWAITVGRSAPGRQAGLASMGSAGGAEPASAAMGKSPRLCRVTCDCRSAGRGEGCPAEPGGDTRAHRCRAPAESRLVSFCAASRHKSVHASIARGTKNLPRPGSGRGGRPVLALPLSPWTAPSRRRSPQADCSRPRPAPSGRPRPSVW